MLELLFSAAENCRMHAGPDIASRSIASSYTTSSSLRGFATDVGYDYEYYGGLAASVCIK